MKIVKNLTKGKRMKFKEKEHLRIQVLNFFIETPFLRPFCNNFLRPDRLC